MFGKSILTLSVLALATAQIPSLGFCPEYIPMANFDMERFLGTWYEAEKYFQLSEVVSRCVMANYTKTIDGKYRVSNQVTNRLTGVKRILDGEIKPAASKADEGKLQVKYTIPLTPETKYSVLETDYDTYAVLWSCQNLGLAHTQNAWIMTRQRIPPGEVLQKAYGVLDKYQIPKTFFVRTDQTECSFLEAPPSNQSAENHNTRSAVTLKDDADAEPKKPEASNASSDNSEIIPEKKKPLNTVPEQILKVAEATKQESNDGKDEKIEEQNAAESAKEENSELPKEAEKTA
ncbi:apolipoprotein D-like [Pseudomyrmex gracilis]|uniref:apolipoprotein D-like n=1 Tax=Pseudomyrmex gracilis TaxID=219809 RepID=UPI000994F045|nr:apolipoprotein D-like [Pseudomyrmex gracilis]